MKPQLFKNRRKSVIFYLKQNHFSRVGKNKNCEKFIH